MIRRFAIDGAPVPGVFQRCKDDCHPDVCTIHPWTYVVDAATIGKKRRQITKSIFATAEEAKEARDRMVEARGAWKKQSGEVCVGDLFAQGICHPMCVHAWGTEEDECECACGGRYHGRLVGLRVNWEVLRLPPPQRTEGSRRRKPIDSGTRQRVMELRARALGDPSWRYRPATYVREQLAKEGIAATVTQINGWFQWERRKAARR